MEAELEARDDKIAQLEKDNRLVQKKITKYEKAADRVIVVPYSMSEGIRIDDAELGLKRPAQNLNRKGFP